ncbi:MAG TPA: hypothetical protein VEG38_08350 [Acidimicrobiia bacterium]|nr:hypothetical protein [Acidimicrobiia bacterium]
MNTVREVVGFGAFVLGAAALAAVNHHPTHGRRTERERASIEAAAAEVPHTRIADAWARAKLGNSLPLSEIGQSFPLPLRSTSEDTAGIRLTFAGHDGICIDLLTQPSASIVTSRDC